MGVHAFVNRVRAALKSVNCDDGFGLALAFTLLALIAPTLGGEPARLALRYERAALLQGQWWRLLSAHWIHLDLHHALLNALGLALMWALFVRDYSPRQWVLILLAAITAIDLGLWFADSTVLWYVGSSGVLHGVMAAGTLAHLKRAEGEGWLLAGFLLAKLAYEHWVGALPLSGSDPVVVDAHLYGVLGGLIAAAGLRPQPRIL
jgi:rhomboid family GlyGly-CTERM serine protease